MNADFACLITFNFHVNSGNPLVLPPFRNPAAVNLSLLFVDKWG